MKRTICSICMRGGSKGVTNKNIRELNGRPLMAYTIEQAIISDLFDHVIVSTDSNEIASTAKKFGASTGFLRPSKLATDESPKLPVIRHALLEAEKYYGYNFDIIVDLDVTSPLRKVSDITNAYKQFVNEKSDILITGTPARKNPYFNMVEKINGQLQQVKNLKITPTRRQDAPEVFEMNASIYIWKRKALLNNDTLFTQNTSIYVMPEERSIDIDSELDWKFVEFITEKRQK